MKVVKNFLFVIFLMALPLSPALAQSKKAIELSKLVEAFMVSPGTTPDWSMGAGSSTPQIAWVSSGIEDKPSCGQYESCRKGTARVLLNGKEMQHLRQRLVPVIWDLFIASSSPAKFEPEQVEISPSCDTAQCSFDLAKALVNKGIVLKQQCKAGPAPFRQTAYEAKKGEKIIYIVVSENLGSGGSSTSLTLYFKKPTNPQSFCADAKSAE